MGFARARARKERKAISKGEQKAQRAIRASRQNVRGAYAYQMRYDKATRTEAIRNLSACFMLAMNEGYGFGRDRLMLLHDKMQDMLDCITGKYVTVEEIAGYLRDDIGMDIGLAAKDPRATHQRQIELKAVKEMSAAFLMALLDGFGFKAKRLGDAYTCVADLSDRVNRKEITYDDIHKRVEKIMSKKGRKTAC